MTASVMAPVLVPALGGAGTAQAETIKIPKGFLLSEPRATRSLSPVEAFEEWWEISDKLSRPLELDPCGSKKKPRDGRVAMRTVVQGTSGPSYFSEQLVLYRNVEAAKAALDRLRVDVKRCAKGKPPVQALVGVRHRYVGTSIRVGDEALLVKGYSYDKGWREPVGGGRYVVARRGSALILFTADDYYQVDETVKTLVGETKKMAKKVCGLPGVCEPEPITLPDQTA
ncbi:hypothetical protein [Microtetraspora sp. NBRC 16547]|uniref:hypothetical protein n=1 Tax=Microtetraspora sp. NBRC 16547 TaxID=3030993 RepID=UPI002556565D|nr:hypothetical protein [Microtetraspora sp. NBRC 16547]